MQPTVPNHFVPSLVSFALRQRVAPESLFARIGRSLESARRVGAQFSLREVEQLFEALCDDVQEPALALYFGHEVDAEKLGLFGLLLSTSGSPRGSFAALSEFKALLHPLLDLSVEERGECTYLRYVANDGGPIGDKPYYAEALLSTVHYASALFRGEPVRPAYVAFRHRAPGYLRAYEQTFRCRVRFEQPVDELRASPPRPRRSRWGIATAATSCARSRAGRARAPAATDGVRLAQNDTRMASSHTAVEIARPQVVRRGSHA